MLDARSSPDRSRFWLCGLALVSFCAACLLPAIAWDGGIENRGIELLETGVLGVLFAPPAGFAWLANPLMMVAAIALLRRSYRVALQLALTSLVIGFGLTLSSVYFPLPADEAGVATLVFYRGLPGFWLWLDAPALIATYCWLYLRKFSPDENRRFS